MQLFWLAGFLWNVNISPFSAAADYNGGIELISFMNNVYWKTEVETSATSPT